MVRARLDKAGDGVLCGIQDCGKHIAKVQTYWVIAMTDEQRGEFFAGYEARWRGRHGGPRREFGFVRSLTFLEGWAPRADGVWALTRRAGDRIKERRPGHLRRRPIERMADGSAIEYIDHGMQADPPAWAICPRCGTRQLLDGDELWVHTSGGAPAG